MILGRVGPSVSSSFSILAADTTVRFEERTTFYVSNRFILLATDTLTVFSGNANTQTMTVLLYAMSF